MIIEMDYNLLGMKARTVPRCRAEIFRARNIFSFPEALRGEFRIFFALSSANSIIMDHKYVPGIINNCQYKNTLFFLPK